MGECALPNKNPNINAVFGDGQTTSPRFAESHKYKRNAVRILSQGEISAARPLAMSPSRSNNQPHIEIVEQPASKGTRFRYECEGRSAGRIPGARSLPDEKTYPTVRIVGCKGPATVVVSCVSKNPPYRPHPHNLVGRDGCNNGVCYVDVDSENMSVTFPNLGIRCTKRTNIEETLSIREELRVDPFQTGFEHKKEINSIDLNAVRLCFQAFIDDSKKGKFYLPPVVSQIIYDKKAVAALVICKLCDCSATVAGGKHIILMCEKVAKEDICIRFFEEKGGKVVWEGFGSFSPSDVHKQTSISFRTPRYKNQDVDEPVQVHIQLMRPSDGETSEALPFQLLPLDAGDPGSLKRKRQKLNTDSTILKPVQREARKHREGVSSGAPYDRAIGNGKLSRVTPAEQENALNQPPSALHTQKAQLPAPTIDYSSYNIPFMNQQPQLTGPAKAHPFPVFTIPSSPSAYEHQPHDMCHQQEKLMTLKKVTPVQPGAEYVQLIEKREFAEAGASIIAMGNTVDMDSRQSSFEQALSQLDSAELGLYENSLSENFSSNLSLSDIKTEACESTRTETATIGENNNIMDSNIINHCYPLKNIF